MAWPYQRVSRPGGEGRSVSVGVKSGLNQMHSFVKVKSNILKRHLAIWILVIETPHVCTLSLFELMNKWPTHSCWKSDPQVTHKNGIGAIHQTPEKWPTFVGHSWGSNRTNNIFEYDDYCFWFWIYPLADMILKLSELGSAGCGKCLGRGKLALWRWARCCL